MAKNFKGFNHGKEIIVIKSKGGAEINVKPIEIHLKENGTKTGGPSLAIVSVDIDNNQFVGQISIEMLNEGLADIGYKLVKTNLN